MGETVITIRGEIQITCRECVWDVALLRLHQAAALTLCTHVVIAGDAEIDITVEPE